MKHLCLPSYIYSIPYRPMIFDKFIKKKKKKQTNKQTNKQKILDHDCDCTLILKLMILTKGRWLLLNIIFQCI